MCVKRTNNNKYLTASSGWNVWTRCNSIMAASLCFCRRCAVLRLNLTVAVLSEFVSWECASTLAGRLSTDYLNEMLTLPEATRLCIRLDSSWDTPAVLTITPVFFYPLRPPAFSQPRLPHTSAPIKLCPNTIRPICHCGGRNKSTNRDTHCVSTMATASFRTLSPNSRTWRFRSTRSSDNRPSTETWRDEKQESLLRKQHTQRVDLEYSNTSTAIKRMNQVINVPSWQKISASWQQWKKDSDSLSN